MQIRRIAILSRLIQTRRPKLRTTEIQQGFELLNYEKYRYFPVLLLLVASCAPPASKLPAPGQKDAVQKEIFELDPVATVFHREPFEAADRAENQSQWLRAAKLYPTLGFRDTMRVRYFMNRYLTKSRPFVEDSLKRAPRYLPMMKRVFIRAGLPVELTYLAIVESRLKPRARSGRGAVGIWQFMKGTARHAGLTVNAIRDERKDPVRSSAAAAKYLEELHQRFDNWMLAIAAYNAGPTTVARLIEKHGSDNFFELSEKGAFSKETDQFVHKFIALVLILRHSDLFGFDSGI